MCVQCDFFLSKKIDYSYLQSTTNVLADYSDFFVFAGAGRRARTQGYLMNFALTCVEDGELLVYAESYPHLADSMSSDTNSEISVPQHIYHVKSRSKGLLRNSCPISPFASSWCDRMRPFLTGPLYSDFTWYI